MRRSTALAATAAMFAVRRPAGRRRRSPCGWRRSRPTPAPSRSSRSSAASSRRPASTSTSTRNRAALRSRRPSRAARSTCRIFAKVYDAIGEGFMIAGWFVAAPWADAHPDAVRRFVAAIRETAAWANRNPEQSLPILVKYTKLGPRIAPRVVRARFAETLTAAILQPSVDLVAGYKLIDAVCPAPELIYPVKG